MIRNELLPQLSATQLQRAARMQASIEKQQRQLASLLSGGGTGRTAPARRKRRMSAAWRAKIAKSRKAAWKRQKQAEKQK